MSRLSPIKTDDLTPEQQAVYDGIIGGKRGTNRPLAEFLAPNGGMRGPFNAMLHHPALGDGIQRLGEILRFEGTLSGPLREVAILTVGRHWRAQYEWWAHVRIAQKEGVDDAVIQAIYDREPLPTDNADILAVHGFVRELLETQHVSDAAYGAAIDVLGEQGVVEVVYLAGYYGLVSGVLNTFQVPLPEGETPLFDE